MLRPLPPIVPVLVLLGGGACLVEKVLRSRFARGHGRWQCPAGRRLQCSPVLPGEYPARTQIDWSAGIIEMLVTHERHVLDRAAKGVQDSLQCIVRLPLVNAQAVHRGGVAGERSRTRSSPSSAARARISPI